MCVIEVGMDGDTLYTHVGSTLQSCSGCMVEAGTSVRRYVGMLPPCSCALLALVCLPAALLSRRPGDQILQYGDVS